jgi:hypothetical protein
VNGFVGFEKSMFFGLNTKMFSKLLPNEAEKTTFFDPFFSDKVGSWGVTSGYGCNF